MRDHANSPIRDSPIPNPGTLGVAVATGGTGLAFTIEAWGWLEPLLPEWPLVGFLLVLVGRLLLLALPQDL